MRKIVGRIASVGTAVLAASAALVMTVPHAQASASYWTWDAPKSATKVGTLKSQTITWKYSFTVQLRSGKYGNYTYIWPRVPKSSAADGLRLWLSVYNPSTGKWESGQQAIIKNTTYSQGHRALSGRLYKACVKADIIGGTAAKCTGSWLV
ncbi:hypothetical protein HD597_009492 [Nonomuraea thailandensis]|uniref:Secreted protein n=1 Tax=Nonomuraea thailandensis TaxID=1188745 RepID=A0A9X2GRA7_9ACTN|nr:hypothetical protein [Nonomuraea thailandensis]MCP2362472.1 hypothetical protein [Nonomuraea thailandensis]